MTIWTALFISYPAIILVTIEDLRIKKRPKNLEIKLSDFESKRGVCCLRV